MDSLKPVVGKLQQKTGLANGCPRTEQEQTKNEPKAKQHTTHTRNVSSQE
tara:strand:+ start:89 stop:238 length:150 start_codon:yes stop_codon:yes gene_type:complete